MASSHATKTGNPLFDHPGWSATLFAILTLAGFLGLLYVAATDHSAHPAPGAAGHGKEHGGVTPSATGAAPPVHH